MVKYRLHLEERQLQFPFFVGCFHQFEPVMVVAKTHKYTGYKKGGLAFVRILFLIPRELRAPPFAYRLFHFRQELRKRCNAELFYIFNS
jgi:hypothetical protein